MHPVYVMTADSAASSLSPPEFNLALAGGHGAPAPSRFANTLAGNLLQSPSQLVQQASSFTGRMLLWSGWYEPDADAGSLPSPMTWSPAAWTSLAEFCTAVATLLSLPTAVPDTRLCFLPRAGDILSDLPSCQRFLNHRSDWAGPLAARFEILLDPIGMLTPDMLPFASEHIERIMLGLGRVAGVSGVVLSNVSPGQNSVTREAVHEGIIPIQHLRSLLQDCDPNLPILMTNDNLAAQLEALAVKATA